MPRVFVLLVGVGGCREGGPMYQVDIVHKKEMVFQATSPGGSFLIDASAREGVTPPDVVLAGLASCVGVYIRKYALGASLALDNFNVSARAEFTKEPPFCFKEIQVSVDLGNASIDERRKKSLVEFIKNCPVHNTLKNNSSVTIEVK